MRLTSFVNLLASVQMVVSLALAAAMGWGYLSYQSSMGSFIHSLAASIGAVSNVVIRTAETVEARRDLIEQTGEMLVVTRKLINELRVAADNQAKIAPQYAQSLRSAANLTSRLGDTLNTTADRLLVINVPASVRMEGMKPVFVMSRPFEAIGAVIKLNAKEVVSISEGLSGASTAISRDGQNLSVAFVETSEQALKVIVESEKTLDRLKSQDLPKALADLRTTSDNLRAISLQVDTYGQLGWILLVIGLLLAGWCFLNSVSTLLISRANTVAFRDRVTA